MSIEFLASVPKSDPGSEGGIGFDYQWHITSSLCIEMLLDAEALRVICEYGEDITLHKKNDAIEKIQVKKRDSGKWTLSELIKPDKKQKKGILSKLLEPLEEGKRVAKLSVLGCGKIGTDRNSDISLSGLVALLNIPLTERDIDWDKSILPCIEYLSKNLSAQGISRSTVESAIKILTINFSLPNPESIEIKNKECLAKAVKQIWEIDITHNQADKIYSAIYFAAKRASTSSRKSWVEKSITRLDISQLVLQNLEYPYATANQIHSLTLQDKLSRANIGDKHRYALITRTEAIGLKFEKGFLAESWEKFGVEIHLKWQDYRRANPTTSGMDLWSALLIMFENIGGNWAKEHKDPRLGSRFVEGVFFDMAGICTVDFKRDSHE